jgi:hypothetical protein
LDYSDTFQAVPGGQGPSKLHTIVSKALATGDNIANITGSTAAINNNPLLEYFSEDELWRVAMVTVCLLLALAVFIYMLAHEDARCKYLNKLTENVSKNSNVPEKELRFGRHWRYNQETVVKESPQATQLFLHIL